MAPILAYWDVRGVANPIRMLLHYAEVRFEDKRYSLEGNKHDEWFKNDKPALQETLDFPNLPYYIDGMVQITQSKTILQYLGRKHGLEPTSETEKINMSMAMEQCFDFANALGRIAYPPTQATNREEVHEKLRKEYAATLDSKLGIMAKFLKDKEWVAGSKLTYGDFYVYDILDYHRQLFKKEHFEKWEVLVDYMKRFEELKGVKNFLNSDKFERLPIYSPFAMFGQSKEYMAQE